MCFFFFIHSLACIMPGRCSSAGLLPRKITREDWNGSFTVRSASKQCFRLYKNTFCVAKCLLGKCPKPLCSAFFNAGCAARRDTFYPMIRSGSLRTCIRCDAASAREAYFICLLQVTSTSIPSRFFKESITGLWVEAQLSRWSLKAIWVKYQFYYRIKRLF